VEKNTTVIFPLPMELIGAVMGAAGLNGSERPTAPRPPAPPAAPSMEDLPVFDDEMLSVFDEESLPVSDDDGPLPERAPA
jgi:hypothetical protein